MWITGASVMLPPLTGASVEGHRFCKWSVAQASLLVPLPLDGRVVPEPAVAQAGTLAPPGRFGLIVD